ncbi:MAG: hypothetical protein DRH30_14045 [Deltaproteobacteria bacterium]|nr:MAG: hypothetical protein DRH30_14045 [Deltaproteobacteria bacterium]
MGGSAGTGGVDTASVTFFVQPFVPGGGIEPLEGVEICETDTTNCVMTDANGNAVLELPVDQEVSYTLEKEGYASYLDSAIISAPTEALVGMATVQRFADMYALVMSPYPMEGTGSIFIDTTEALVGATFELLDTTGKAFYRDEDLNFSLDLTATTSGGGGGFVEVSPGVFQVGIGGTAESCELFRGWPGDVEGDIKVPVREGYFSRAILVCP